MRPLTCDKNDTSLIAAEEGMICTTRHSGCSTYYEENLQRLRDTYHSQCLFNRWPSFVPGLRFSFNHSGDLLGEFTCNGFQQGYNEMVHGGVIASIVDASMAQCLMGHGVVGYTVDLSVKYRKPVLIHTKTTLQTTVMERKCGSLYFMKCEMFQQRNRVIQATGRFYKVKKCTHE